MRVRVLFFGVLRDLMGATERDLEVADGLTAGAIVAMCHADSAQSGVWTSVATAVNQEYAGRDRVLVNGDEVALLPPVSGGAAPECDSADLHV